MTTQTLIQIVVQLAGLFVLAIAAAQRFARLETKSEERTEQTKAALSDLKNADERTSNSVKAMIDTEVRGLGAKIDAQSGASQRIVDQVERTMREHRTQVEQMLEKQRGEQRAELDRLERRLDAHGDHDKRLAELNTEVRNLRAAVDRLDTRYSRTNFPAVRPGGGGGNDDGRG